MKQSTELHAHLQAVQDFRTAFAELMRMITEHEQRDARSQSDLETHPGSSELSGRRETRTHKPLRALSGV